MIVRFGGCGAHTASWPLWKGDIEMGEILLDGRIRALVSLLAFMAAIALMTLLVCSCDPAFAAAL